MIERDDEEDVFPISFMISVFNGVELKYPPIERQTYALLNIVKNKILYFEESHHHLGILSHRSNIVHTNELGEKRGN
jgi:hypothetical protein